MLDDIHKPLIGVIHLPALPGAPRYEGVFSPILDGARRDAEALAAAGFDAVIVENFGDAPFFRGRVPAETVASMAVVCEAVRRASGLPLGVNVLRNDGESALAVAVASGARFIRVNVLVGARVTDQGVIEADAANLLRARARLGAQNVSIAADVAVKHSVALGAAGEGSIEEEALEAVERALADAVIVTGSRTGSEADPALVARVRGAVPKAKLWLGSGARADTLAAWLTRLDGVIVGSDLRADGRAGGPIDPARARHFASMRGLTGTILATRERP
jgi:membrane complex biogenesis BtpA family protein